MVNYIKLMLPKSLRKLTYPLRERIFDLHSTKSYSQEGEDLVLRRVFEGRKSGFYVDVGAHHPHRFSNTNLFYKAGWHGINIEPNPDSIADFKRLRQRDINLQCGVSDIEQHLTYYKFNEPALNTFDPDIVDDRLNKTTYKVVQKIIVPVLRLDHILDDHLAAGQKIDFLTVDVEGLDLQVLESNNWSAYRPAMVLAESLCSNLADASENEIARFMSAQGYSVFAKTYNTWMFKDQLSES